jgi:hypothetical protein
MLLTFALVELYNLAAANASIACALGAADPGALVVSTASQFQTIAVFAALAGTLHGVVFGLDLGVDVVPQFAAEDDLSTEGRACLLLTCALGGAAGVLCSRNSPYAALSAFDVAKHSSVAMANALSAAEDALAVDMGGNKDA